MPNAFLISFVAIAAISVGIALEVAQAAEELNARALLPGHAGKFAIANHPWDEPFARIVKASQDKAYTLLTPRIGEPVELGNTRQTFARWWEKLA